MEWIAQAALGALIGEIMMGKRLGKRALAWGGLFGILPNIDILLFPLLDTARETAWHRGPTHSLIIMALASWGISRGLAKIWKREKISQSEAAAFVAVAWSSHLLVDILTIPGAQLGWPISNHRISLNLVHPTDFVIAVPWVLAVAGLAFLPGSPVKKTKNRKAAPPTKRALLCRWGLGLSAGYVVLAAGLKWTVSSGFEADLSRRATGFERRMEIPTPFNILLWRSVVDRKDEFWVGYKSVFELPSTPVRWTVYPQMGEALASVADQRETKALKRFTEGWWISRPHAKGAWLGDLRLPESRTWGSKTSMVDSRLADSWLIQVTAKNDRLRSISPERSGPDETLSRLGGRIIGNRENWEAIPRLAGVEGSLPEILGAVE